MMKAKSLIKHALLIFVWISVGFAIGKHATLRAVQHEQNRQEALSGAAAPDAEPGGAETPEYRVQVRYLHGNIRCVTCNSIEAMTRQVLEEEFAEALADGTLTWSVTNFQRDTEVGRRYDVAGSSVVLALEKQGVEVSYRILDEVWVLVNDEDQFRQFMREVVDEYMSEGAAA